MNEKTVTEWNQAQAYQIRIHEILVNCHEASMTPDLKLWCNCIWSFYRELSPILDDSEHKEALKNIRECQNLVGKEHKGNAYETFVFTETFLRRIMSDKGLLVPPVEDRTKLIIGGKSF